MKKKLTGVAVPLGALYTKDNSVIGEFGDLKPFADFCKAAGISIIQLLPVNDTGTQSSPYSGLSAFALHPIYIRINEVLGFGALYKSDAKFKKAYDDFIRDQKYSLRYNYDAILNGKNVLLKMLYDASDEGKSGEAGNLEYQAHNHAVVAQDAEVAGSVGRHDVGNGGVAGFLVDLKTTVDAVAEDLIRGLDPEQFLVDRNSGNAD